MTRTFNRDKFFLFISAVLVFFAAFLTLFQHWEMTHETWQYWFFAKILAATGQFPVIDRSPLYTVYLELFRFLGYPNGVTVEYVATMFLSVFTLFKFIKKFAPWAAALLGAIYWIPVFQSFEPSVQILAMASALAGIMLREKGTRQGIIWSYVLFLGSYLFRSSYSVLILLFLTWDLVRYFRKRKSRIALPDFRSGWPLLAGVLFVLLVAIFQSPHRWNNVWGASTTWFPSNGKSFVNMLQNYNASYIILTYGQYQDHDFYQTNKEVFPGADNLIQAYMVNPGFMQRVAGEYFKVGVAMVSDLTWFAGIRHFPEQETGYHVFYIILLFLGAYLSGKNIWQRLFVLASLGMLALTIVHSPKLRYMTFIVPVLMMSASWYASMVWKIIDFFLRFLPRLRKPVAAIGKPVLYFCLLTGAFVKVNFGGVYQVSWPDLYRTITANYRMGTLEFLDIGDISIYFPPLKSSYGELARAGKNCRGIMTAEYTFLAAFTDYPEKNIYDIWEIPPFGSLSDPATPYHGLNPDRVNCLFISKNLKYGVGSGTNSQIRYENYIAPYAQYLKRAGAKTISVNGYGELIIL